MMLRSHVVAKPRTLDSGRRLGCLSPGWRATSSAAHHHTSAQPARSHTGSNSSIAHRCFHSSSGPLFSAKMQHSTGGSYHTPTDVPSVSPRSLVKYLDTYVVGQTKAKKVLAVGVWNHYLRVASNQRMKQEHELRLAEQQSANTSAHEPEVSSPEAHPRSLRLGKYKQRDDALDGVASSLEGESWRAQHQIQRERAAERTRDPHGEATRNLMFGRAEREWLVNAGGPSALIDDVPKRTAAKVVPKFGDVVRRVAAKTPAEEASSQLEQRAAAAGQAESSEALAEAASRMHDAVLSDYTPATQSQSQAANVADFGADPPLYFSSNSIAPGSRTARQETKPVRSARMRSDDADTHKWESPHHRAAQASLEERTRRALRTARERLATPSTAPEAPDVLSAPRPGDESGEAAGFLSAQPGTLPFFEKSNILLLGPSGSGKTLLLRTLAQALDVPFVHVDATPLTMAGYVGDDVESIIHRLLVESGWDVERAQRGIVCIDEIDKLRRTSAGGGGGGASSGKDVGGEGVQQALLRMLEGTTIQVADKSGASAAAAAAAGAGAAGSAGGAAGKGGRAWSPLNVPSSSGEDKVPLGPWYNSRRQRVGGRDASGGVPGQAASFSVDTSSVLFVLSGAFVGIEETIRKRLAQDGGDKLATAELLARLEPGDLEQYGLIPEFVGRVPVSVVLSPLTFDDLVRVMTEPRNSLVDQYTALFRLNGIELHVSRGAIEEVVHRALGTSSNDTKHTKDAKDIKTKALVQQGAGGGARSLRRIMEEILLDAFYESYGSSSVKYILIDRQTVRTGANVRLFSRGQKFDFDAQCNAESDNDSKPSPQLKPSSSKARPGLEAKTLDPTRASLARLKARAMVRARLRRTNRLVDPVIYI